MANIYIAVPNQGQINRFVTQALISMAIKTDQQEETHKLYFSFAADKPIDSNRNKMVRQFLQGDWEWFLTIDSDNPPLGNPLDRIKHDKDVLAFPTPIWYSTITEKGKGESPIVWNCFDRAKEGGGWREHSPKDGLQKVSAAGTGCMLIKRKVLEDVKPAFYRLWNDEGIVTVGSDLLFCQRAGDKGFEIWADYSCPCQHFKSTDLSQVYSLLKVRDVTTINRPNINTPEYWDEQWKKRGDRFMPTYPHVVERVKEQMNGQEPFRVLDFGCGRGELMEKISEIDGVEIHGMDFSQESVNIVKSRGMSASVANEPSGNWDMIVCSEVLEHVDDDSNMLNKMLECSDVVLYTVPNNCLPPGQEREHQRCFTVGYAEKITPHVTEISIVDDYLLVVADKKGHSDGSIKQIIDVCVRSAAPG